MRRIPVSLRTWWVCLNLRIGSAECSKGSKGGGVVSVCPKFGSEEVRELCPEESDGESARGPDGLEIASC